MTTYRLALLIILCLGSFISPSFSSPKLHHNNQSLLASREFTPPVEKKNLHKKYKKRRGKKRLKFKPNSIHRSKTTISPFIAFLLLVLILLVFLFPFISIIVGGILGLAGWVYAGFIIGCLSLILTCFLVFKEPYSALTISIFYILASLALVIWGLIALLPIINIVSIIIGSIALILLILSIAIIAHSK